jgi:hypothetical protein
VGRGIDVRYPSHINKRCIIKSSTKKYCVAYGDLPIFNQINDVRIGDISLYL